MKIHFQPLSFRKETKIQRVLFVVFSSQIKKIQDKKDDGTGVWIFPPSFLNKTIEIEIHTHSPFQALLILQTETNDFVSNLSFYEGEIQQAP